MISIVSPVYNELEVLPEFCRRLTAVMEEYREPYEIVLVNDGSKDGTFSVMKALHTSDPRIRAVDLSRNFGHQVAICAGLDFATGDLIAIMDSDLQDPPEVLPRFFKKLREGYDVVYAVRTGRKESLFKKAAYAAFYRLLKSIANVDIPLDSGDFCVMSRRALDTLKSMPERNRFLRGLRGWIGFRQVGVEYERERRFAGDVKYTFSKLLKLAFDGLTSFSYVPLRLASILGLFMSFISFVAILIIFYLKFFTSATVPVPGWASVVVAILVLGGIQLVATGIIGEYLGRVYDEVKRRPLYVVQETLGIEAEKEREKERRVYQIH
ncbi:MAG TPA: glycosyltransferase family 2 protein [Thermodesulfobacteriota bacterium]|nr:glycosyltransferase family 2 protein [Thermodesulfobacteriota bacterium]